MTKGVEEVTVSDCLYSCNRLFMVGRTACQVLCCSRTERAEGGKRQGRSRGLKGSVCLPVSSLNYRAYGVTCVKEQGSGDLSRVHDGDIEKAICWNAVSFPLFTLLFSLFRLAQSHLAFTQCLRVLWVADPTNTWTGGKVVIHYLVCK